jgi:Flp pilus assembly pilin Flp
MKNLIVRFVREEEGQDLIEYALLGGVITAGSAGFIITIGANVVTLFTALDTVVETAAS